MNVLLGILFVMFVALPAFAGMLRGLDAAEQRRRAREGDGTPRKRHWREP